ncbi:MAG: hypothetical protein LBI13_06730 [Streptococcaceae bacterium]|jgi:TfoX/Sxy family transcriptional regulator of competence genes|nr:hypothetical protein [Streptococcaceae bacterium]
MVQQNTDMGVVQQRVQAIKAVEQTTTQSEIQTKGSLSVLSNGKSIFTELYNAEKTAVSESHDFADRVQDVANKKFEEDAKAAKMLKGEY